MPRIVKQARVEQDLLDIWLYTYNEWGERLELVPPVRIHRHAHHLIVYLTLSDGINVVRVLHVNMDVDGQLE